MSQVLSTVVDVLQELRIDLQDFFWLIAQHLHIDSTLVNISDQVFKIGDVKMHVLSVILIRF